MMTPHFFCDKCGQGFETRRQLNDHLPTHRNEVFACRQCEKTFVSNTKLKNHIRDKHWVQLNFEFGIPIPNKVHIIFDHLEEFIERQIKPLGEFSEEVVEAAHQRLDQIWQWYIVKMVEKESHGTNFLACVNHFNSLNI